MNRFAEHTTLIPEHDLTFLAGTPYVYHCHHFNLFHDQTIDDVMGEDAGFAMRAEVAAAAFAPLLTALYERASARTIPERLELAQALFASMGQGRVDFDLSGSTPRATSTHAHYGFAWREKYGSRVRRFDPVDSVAAGFVAAVFETTSERGDRFEVVEKECIAMRASSCVFEGRPATRPRPPRLPLEADLRPFFGPSERGVDEAAIAEITKGLQGFLRGVSGDERGLVQAFNVFVTQHLASYYNETGFNAVRHAEAVSRPSVGPAEDLLREAGHVCVFHTFGNILLSPEWEGMVGPLGGAPEEIVRGCTAIARGLGFGRWAVAEFEKGRRLVLRAGANYEAAHWRFRHGVSERSRSYFMQGAALAFMVLAHRVPWAERPQLDGRFYDDLFRRSGGLGFSIDVPRCVTRGDDVTEVVIAAQ